MRKIFSIIIPVLFILFIINPVYANANIVNPKQVYTYEIMQEDIKKLAEKYPDIISYKIIGTSEYGRNIYAVSLGKGETTVFINGSHHAREWLTTNLNMHMLEQYAIAYKNNQSIEGYNARDILNKTTIWFVPMVNPDGVTLQQFGLDAFPSHLHNYLIELNDGSTDFKRWKANAKGIDLNRQYEADWKNIQKNRETPGYSHHKGNSPLEAKEAKALYNFTLLINPEISVSYHSTGRIIYWNFDQVGEQYERDHKLVKKFSQITGYDIVYPGPNPSGGGYTDWFIHRFKKPAFTPEISYFVYESNPPISVFDEEWDRNKPIGLFVAQEGYKLVQNRKAEEAVLEKKKQELQQEINGNLLYLNHPIFVYKTYFKYKDFYPEIFQ